MPSLIRRICDKLPSRPICLVSLIYVVSFTAIPSRANKVTSILLIILLAEYTYSALPLVPPVPSPPTSTSTPTTNCHNCPQPPFAAVGGQITSTIPHHLSPRPSSGARSLTRAITFFFRICSCAGLDTLCEQRLAVQADSIFDIINKRV